MQIFLFSLAGPTIGGVEPASAPCWAVPWA